MNEDLTYEINSVQGDGDTKSSFTVRPSVAKFAMLMEKILQTHDAAKGETGWRAAQMPVLLNLNLDAQDDLSEAVSFNDSKREVAVHAANLANLTMMIAENYCGEDFGG